MKRFQRRPYLSLLSAIFLVLASGCSKKKEADPPPVGPFLSQVPLSTSMSSTSSATSPVQSQTGLLLSEIKIDSKWTGMEKEICEATDRLNDTLFLMGSVDERICVIGKLLETAELPETFYDNSEKYVSILYTGGSFRHKIRLNKTTSRLTDGQVWTCKLDSNTQSYEQVSYVNLDYLEASLGQVSTVDRFTGTEIEIISRCETSGGFSGSTWSQKASGCDHFTTISNTSPETSLSDTVSFSQSSDKLRFSQAGLHSDSILRTAVFEILGTSLSSTFAVGNGSLKSSRFWNPIEIVSWSIDDLTHNNDLESSYASEASALSSLPEITTAFTEDSVSFLEAETWDCTLPSDTIELDYTTSSISHQEALLACSEKHALFAQPLTISACSSLSENYDQ